ncbi:MAG: guanylate kinase [Synergistaceae bacterium]|jgi:guanylate kinase|nr:guanylate kinase [Synergistaceae bacterium]
MSRKGNLFILSGPAGAGKGTLRKILFKELPDLVYSVSCTTRQRRPGETEGKDYYFTGKNEFAEMIRENAFLEWAEVHGNYYGTRKSDVETCLDLGRDMVLEIDVQGSRQVKISMPDAVRIFITVSSMDELENRLEDRGTETPDQMLLRLRNAAFEMRYAGECEHTIVNDDVARSSAELINLVMKYRNGKGTL